MDKAIERLIAELQETADWLDQRVAAVAKLAGVEHAGERHAIARVEERRFSMRIAHLRLLIDRIIPTLPAPDEDDPEWDRVEYTHRGTRCGEGVAL